VVGVQDGPGLLFQRLDSLRPPPPIVPVPGHSIGQVAFDRGANWLAVSTTSVAPIHTIHVVSIHGNEEMARMIQPSVVCKLFYAEQRSRIVTLGLDRRVRRWQLPRLDEPRAFDDSVSQWPNARLLAQAKKRLSEEMSRQEWEAFRAIAVLPRSTDSLVMPQVSQQSRSHASERLCPFAHGV
jgi:hypothetical protein